MVPLGGDTWTMVKLYGVTVDSFIDFEGVNIFLIIFQVISVLASSVAVDITRAYK